MYSAIVLDEASQLKLEKLAEDVRVAGVRLPILVRDNGWKMYNHHMTINMGELPNYLKQYIGTKQKLEATHIGVSPMAVAVRVIGFESKNTIPHITMAVNIPAGGKPFMSNKITDWTSLATPLKLSGTVQEVQQ
jgi:hypothetical protein